MATQSSFSTAVTNGEIKTENGAITPPLVKNENGDENVDKTNLIINYLPQNMSCDEVSELFAECGEIASCKLIRDRGTNQSLGYGFVKFETEESAEKAINKFNGMKLATKVIKVSHARPSSDLIKNANLYVSGLGTEMSEEEVSKLFSEHGNIITTRILCDADGKSKGVCFVRYNARTEAEEAIGKLNGHTLPGGASPLVVKFANTPNNSHKTSAIPRNHNHAPPQLGHFNGAAYHAHAGFSAAYNTPGAYGAQNGFGHTAYSPPTSLLRALSGAPQTPPNHRMSTGGSSNTSYGSPYRGGVPPYMGQSGGKVRYSPLTNHASPTMPGTAIVPPAQQPPIGMPRVHGFNRHSPTPHGHTLFIYNIAPDTQEATLWQLFGPFGAVTNVKVVREPTTQECKGYGFVTMTHGQDASNAVANLNGTSIGTRQLQVSFKRQGRPPQ